VTDVTTALPLSPELLDREAADLDTEALAADFEPARLRIRAAELRARAATLRAVDAARAALVDAEAATTAAESVYAGFAEAEAAAARRALDARCELDTAGDAVRATIKASPADQIGARMRANAAAEVVQHEEAALGRVRLDRQDARADLDAAEHRAAVARERLAAAEAAADNPAAAEIDDKTRGANLIWTWQQRIMLDASGDPQWRLSPADRDLIRGFAAVWADACGVGQKQAKESAYAEVTAAMKKLRIMSASGAEVTAHQLLSGQ
jgi:hypothetical protein